MTSKPSFSFEFFPPKTEALAQKLWHSIKELEKYSPKFVSVTYGAGGSTKLKTHETIKKIIDGTALKPAAHLTCVGATQQEINEIAQNYWQTGCKHIVALRGDMPNHTGDYQPYPNGYDYAVDLIRGLKKLADFEISTAAYPEGHPQAKSLDDDISYLKSKFDAGADRAITQYFFDNNFYYDFLDKAEKKNINKPIIAGVIPINNFTQIKKFSKMCGASIPKNVEDIFANLTDEQSKLEASVDFCTKQCQDLIDNGQKHIHFYSLNRSDIISKVIDNLV